MKVPIWVSFVVCTGVLALGGRNDNAMQSKDSFSTQNLGHRQLTGEFQVNTHVTGDQDNVVTTALVGGDIVVVWQSADQDGDSDGIFAQRYTSSLVKAGAEFQVNTHTADKQSNPAIAALQDGGFIIVWTSYDQDGEYDGIYAQRFDASGTAVGIEFQVNVYTSSSQSLASVAGLASGGFVVTWESVDQIGASYDIFAQVYNAAGGIAASEFLVNTESSSMQRAPAVASLSDGGFAITWQSLDQDGSSYGVYAQRFTAAASPAGAEFLVNTHTDSFQSMQEIVGLVDGGFVVTWGSLGQDGSSGGVYAQIFNSDGSKRGSELQVNTYTSGNQRGPKVTELANGAFAIVWQSADQDGDSNGIFAQFFGSTGGKIGDEFQVNTFTAGHQSSPDLAPLSDGDFVAFWASQNQDSSGYGVFGTRVEWVTPAPTTTPTIGSSSAPSAIPTSTPTISPTNQPTAASSEHIVVHLYDIHGDGWFNNLYLQVHGVDGTEMHSLHCSCKVVRVFSGDVSFSIWRNQSNPKQVVPYEWEALWTVGFSDGLTETDFGIVGNVDTKVEIRDYALVNAVDVVDYDDRKPANKCIPPKPKPGVSTAHVQNITDPAKPEPPSPLVDVRLALMTTEGYGSCNFMLNSCLMLSVGWCDDSGESSTLACDKEHHSSSNAVLPNLVLYPRYYISRTDDNRVVASGTLREDMTEWVTSVKLLREGSYVFSVSGTYTASSGTVSWDFCGEEGGINERLHFNMVKSVCRAHYLEEVSDGLTCYESLNGATLDNSIDELQASSTLQSFRQYGRGFLVLSGAMVAVALAFVLVSKLRTHNKKSFVRLDTTEHA